MLGGRVRVAAGLAAVVALVATASVAVVGDLQARWGRERTRHQLQATREQLATANQQLAGSRNNVADTRSVLASTVNQLGTTTAALAASVAALTSTQGQLHISQSQAQQLQGSLTSAQHALTAVQGNLSAAQVAIYLEGGQIVALRSCLGGVTMALNQLAVGQQAGALTSLQGAAVSCTAAESAANPGPAPVYPFDFADPFILRAGATYYGFATNAAGGNIQMIQSGDLAHWSSLGRDAMAQLPPWALPHGTWGPSVLPVPGGYVLYYSAWVGFTERHCIGRATSANPTGPYVDNSSAPLVCQLDLGGSIDPSPYRAPDGSVYLVWKSDGAGQAAIWGQQLTNDGLSVEGQPVRILGPDQPWQGGIVEGPDLIQLGGALHLLYSANDWNTPAYGVGDAICQRPLGPCRDAARGAVLASAGGALGPGGPASFTDTSGVPWLAYHAWDGTATGYPNSRKLYLARVSVTGTAITVGA